MGAKRIISCMITYNTTNGYSTKLKDIVNEENIRVCRLKEDGSIDYELDKDQYFVSDSIIYLPLYLNKESVLIHYDKIVDAEYTYSSSNSYTYTITYSTSSNTIGSWTL